jgi:hypothetical protein
MNDKEGNGFNGHRQGEGWMVLLPDGCFHFKPGSCESSEWSQVYLAGRGCTEENRREDSVFPNPFARQFLHESVLLGVPEIYPEGSIPLFGVLNNKQIFTAQSRIVFTSIVKAVNARNIDTLTTGSEL